MCQLNFVSEDHYHSYKGGGGKYAMAVGGYANYYVIITLNNCLNIKM